MPMHALKVTENTIDFIEQVNGGVRPADECLKNETFFVHPDRVDDIDATNLMTPEEFHSTYEYHECGDANCNIVVKK